MIKPNELRKGNLIKYTGEPYPYYPLNNGIVEVEEVLNDGVNRSQGDSTIYESENLEGIPLTPEWLERLSFEERGQCYIKGAVTIRKNMYRDGSGHYDGFSMWLDNEGRKIILSIKEVHQLQNLYFALTGEELTIAEKV